jgi:hypothetical protein
VPELDALFDRADQDAAARGDRDAALARGSGRVAEPVKARPAVCG